MSTTPERAALRYAAIEKLLREVGEPMTAPQVWASLLGLDVDWSHERARQDLQMMERKGRVYHPVKGLWAILDGEGEAP